MVLQESGEMYLETIYILSQKSKSVRSKDICEYMGYSKPSVSRAMSILREGGFIEMDRENYITLTESGLKIAKTIYERHTLLSEYLIFLGVDPKTAVDDACKIEHVISEESFAAIKSHATKYGVLSKDK